MHALSLKKSLHFKSFKCAINEIKYIMKISAYLHFFYFHFSIFPSQKVNLISEKVIFVDTIVIKGSRQEYFEHMSLQHRDSSYKLCQCFPFVSSSSYHSQFHRFIMCF